MTSNKCSNCKLKEVFKNEKLPRVCAKKLCYPCTIYEAVNAFSKIKSNKNDSVFKTVCCENESFSMSPDEIMEYIAYIRNNRSSVETTENEMNFICINPNCISGTKNVKYCVECNKMLCENCLKFVHNKDSLHTLMEESEKSIINFYSNYNFKCKNHPFNERVMFCKDCNKLECILCCNDSHEDHSVEYIKQLVDKNNADIEKEFMKTRVCDNLKKIKDDLIAKLEEEFNRIKNLIDTKFSKHIQENSTRNLLEFEKEVYNEYRKIPVGSLAIQQNLILSKNENNTQERTIEQPVVPTAVISAPLEEKQEVTPSQTLGYNNEQAFNNESSLLQKIPLNKIQENIVKYPDIDDIIEDHGHVFDLVENSYVIWNKKEIKIRWSDQGPKEKLLPLKNFKSILYVSIGYSKTKNEHVVLTTAFNEIFEFTKLYKKGKQIPFPVENGLINLTYANYGDSNMYCLTTDGLVFERAQENWTPIDLGNHRIKKLKRGYNKFLVGITKKYKIITWGIDKLGRRCINQFNKTTNEFTIVKITNEIGKPLDVECGGYHVIAMFNNGSIYGWGDNSFHQVIGNSSKTSLKDNRDIIAVPQLLPIQNAKSISCGFKHTAISFNQVSSIYGFVNTIKLNDNYIGGVWMNKSSMEGCLYNSTFGSNLIVYDQNTISLGFNMEKIIL